MVMVMEEVVVMTVLMTDGDDVDEDNLLRAHPPKADMVVMVMVVTVMMVVVVLMTDGNDDDNDNLLRPHPPKADVANL